MASATLGIVSTDAALDLLARPSIEVAPLLLGGILSVDGVSLRITEVEAYLGELDPGSHAFRGKRNRNAVMYGPPGHLYTYFTYGMHTCANVVDLPGGHRFGRAAPSGRDHRGTRGCRARRLTTRTDHDLAQGPARLCVALGIRLDDNGADLLGGSRIHLTLPEQPAPYEQGPRTGVSGPGGGDEYPCAVLGAGGPIGIAVQAARAEEARPLAQARQGPVSSTRLSEPSFLLELRLRSCHPRPPQLRSHRRTIPRSTTSGRSWSGAGTCTFSTDPKALKELLAGPPIVYYCGFDPTAPSLHLGNLVQLLLLRRIQLAGHKPLGLVGGSTGLIGDPRPTAERTLNDRDDGGRVGGIPAGTGRQVPELRRRQCGAPREQPRLDRAHERDRLPARHRQALPGRHDAQEGCRQRAPEQRRGHLVHGVQLPDPAGPRLPPALPRLRLRAADRRQRPVGQPHERR